jgi:hypothetical protein
VNREGDPAGKAYRLAIFCATWSRSCRLDSSMRLRSPRNFSRNRASLPELAQAISSVVLRCRR